MYIWSVELLFIFSFFGNIFGDDSDTCALLIPRRDTRISYNNEDSTKDCITYNDIDEAYERSNKNLKLTKEDGDLKTEHISEIGELLLDMTKQIAKRYDLDSDTIERLPLMDTSKSEIKNICPNYLSKVECKLGKYRRHDGLCNNPHHPTWGATMTPYRRILPAKFSDKISTPRKSTTGDELPSARVVSMTIHTDEGYHDHAATVMLVAWGQFMDHDFTLMATPLDPANRNEPEECCNRPDHLKNPHCFEIEISKNDYFYEQHNVKCQDFVRAFPGVRPYCKLGSRVPFNTLTGVIDGNTIYGVDVKVAKKLRSGIGGQLAMNPAFTHIGLKDLLPPKLDIPDEGCTRSNSSQYCFLAGEVRVNEQLVLTCIHTLMAREHNRVALELLKVNPHWDDEKLYQEARRIVIAEIQHITYHEFLPLVLGKEMMKKYDIILNIDGYWNGYNENTNPNIIDAFASAAYRFGHSLLPAAIERWSKAHQFIASKRLSELIRRPYDLYRAGVIDEYLSGLLNQVAQAMDDSVTQEVTNNLFKKHGNYFGLDLVSFNIQRGRDFGLPGYMDFRERCGLKVSETFDGMLGHISNTTIQRYKTIYKHPRDIDLWSGGVSEKPLPGSMVGPTFACIIGTQMNSIRSGDRYWYELPNQPSSFTPGQLEEIRKVKLSRIICENTDLIDNLQIYPMVLPDHHLNPRVSCKSSVLPKMDFTFWKDDSVLLNNTEIRKDECIECESESEEKTKALMENGEIIEDTRENIFHNIVRRNAENATAPLSDVENYDLVPSEENLQVKDIGKRHSHFNYHPSSGKYKKNRMTEAIMRKNSAELQNLNRRSYKSSEDYDMDDMFRDNVPIYDGVVTKSSYKNEVTKFNPKKKQVSSVDDDDDEADGEPMFGLIEVDDDHDAQYEYVQMEMDDDGKPVRVQEFQPSSSDDEESYESKSDDEYDRPRRPKPKYSGSYNSGGSRPYGRLYNRAPSSPYSRSPNTPYSRPPSSSSDPYDTFTPFKHFSNSPYNSHSSRHKYPSSSDSSKSNPSYSNYEESPKYFPHSMMHNGERYTPEALTNFGTSHQYNSAGDNQPHFYSHDYRSQSKDNPIYDRYSEKPRNPPSGNSHDFSIKRGNTPTSPYNGRSPQRITHVPKTLIEYHKLHKTETRRPDIRGNSGHYRQSNLKSENDAVEYPEYSGESLRSSPAEYDSDDDSEPKSYMSFDIGTSESETASKPQRKKRIMIRHKKPSNSRRPVVDSYDNDGRYSSHKAFKSNFKQDDESLLSGRDKFFDKSRYPVHKKRINFGDKLNADDLFDDEESKNKFRYVKDLEGNPSEEIKFVENRNIFENNEAFKGPSKMSSESSNVHVNKEVV